MASGTAPAVPRSASLAGKVALVTGGSRGIGAGIAKTLGALGAKVVVNYAANAGAAADVVEAIVSSGSEAVAVQADVKSFAEVKRLFDEGESKFGKLDIVVHNAAIGQAPKPLAETTDEELKAIIDLDLYGSLYVLREAARRLKDGGRVISISSAASVAKFAGFGAYTAAKAGIDVLTSVLAKELGPRRITVNAVSPGPVQTDLFAAVASDEFVKTITARTPISRLGEVEDISPVVAFLASDGAAWITGQVLHASGGLV